MTINDDIQVILQSMDLSTNMNLQVLESVQREVSCEHIYQTDHLCWTTTEHVTEVSTGDFKTCKRTDFLPCIKSD